MVGAGLHVYTGCMFAGKTRMAISHTLKWRAIQARVLPVKHSLDKRYKEHEFASHDDSTDLVDCHTTDTLMKIRFLPEYAMSDVIVIDEAQFFDDLYDFCKMAVDLHQKRVEVFGLDGTTKREPFGDIARLCPIADTFCKLTAFCGMCMNETQAPFTIATKPFPEGSHDVLIGGSDIYMAVCRRHYLEHTEP